MEVYVIDADTGMLPVFENILWTCKRYLSLDSNIEIKTFMKDNCRDQFQHLINIQLDDEQLTYADMKAATSP